MGHKTIETAYITLTERHLNTYLKARETPTSSPFSFFTTCLAESNFVAAMAVARL